MQGRALVPAALSLLCLQQAALWSGYGAGHQPAVLSSCEGSWPARYILVVLRSGRCPSWHFPAESTGGGK